MDTTPPTGSELLAGTGVGRAKVLKQRTAASEAAGLHQGRPPLATPYVQQVPSPWAPVR